MRQKIERIRRVPCPECEGMPGDKKCLCGGTGDIRDAFKKLQGDYWYESQLRKSAEHKILMDKSAHATRLQELRRLKQKYKSLERSLNAIQELPINYEEANYLYTRRMMMSSGKVSYEFMRKVDLLRARGID